MVGRATDLSTQNNSLNAENKAQKNKRAPDRWRKLVLYICIFAMLGALMFCSKKIMEVLPNIHLLGMFTMVLTLTFRWRALIPLYIYVFLDGLFLGFNVWWYPYLYIWTILWAITMLLPKKMPRRLCMVVYPVICSLHGFAFGILYAPAQALFFDLNFEETLAWIATGAVFDIVHGVSNLATGLLVVPFSELLIKLSRKQGLI